MDNKKSENIIIATVSIRNKNPNKSIQRTVKSGVSLRYTLLLTAADAKR